MRQLQNETPTKNGRSVNQLLKYELKQNLQNIQDLHNLNGNFFHLQRVP
jgi:hypothetical protein